MGYHSFAALAHCKTSSYSRTSVIDAPEPKAILAYLRDCLAEERARSGIPNIFASKVRNRRIIKDEERAAFSEFGSIDLPPSELSALAMTAGLLHRDTSLYYTTIVIASRDQGKVIHTPVLLYPVEVLNYEKEPELRIDHSRASLNPALSNLFDLPADFENELFSLLPAGELNLATPGLIAKDLSRHIPNLDTTPFDLFPQLLSSKEIKSHDATANPALLPASALLLVEKSKNVAGLLHELEELLAQPSSDYPPALQALLGRNIPQAPAKQDFFKKNFAPALLSPAQGQLLQSANSRPLTVCHGPPGTGKSFTISATALDQVARGHSILIACRSDEAASVIETKINELIPRSQLVVRAGRRKHLNKLKSLLDQLIASKPGPPPLPSAPGIALKKQSQNVAKLQQKLTKRQIDELKAAPLFIHPPSGIWQKFLHWKHRQSLQRAPLLTELVNAIVTTQIQRLQLLRAYNEQSHHRHLHKHLGSLKSRDTLKRYREAIGRRVPASQERELLELDLTALVNFLPIWVTTTDDIHRVLPLKPGIFDLVIIDEATQCDLASALPILHRGKRALITGDPQQLRHLSFLSKDRLQNLAGKHQLSTRASEDYNFRKVSFLDRAIAITAGSDSLNFLDEHFRSLPQLISFSNKNFYHGNLHCMREVETLTRKNSQPALIVNTIAGQRNPEGVNEKEIDAVFNHLRQELMYGDCDKISSLGFLSPFRAQVDSFQKRLQEEFSPDYQRRLLHDHQLIAGTAHSFQGAERDTMLISLCIDANSPPAARRFLERPDVFNVSITRARHQIQLFSSIKPGELPADSLLCNYLIHASSEVVINQRNREHHTEFPAGLLERMQQLGWQHLATETEIAGMPVDILFKKEDQIIALDLIGTPDSLGQAVSVEKTLLLKRAGLPLYPLSIAEWDTKGDHFLQSISS